MSWQVAVLTYSDSTDGCCRHCQHRMQMHNAPIYQQLSNRLQSMHTTQPMHAHRINSMLSMLTCMLCPVASSGGDIHGGVSHHIQIPCTPLAIFKAGIIKIPTGICAWQMICLRCINNKFATVILFWWHATASCCKICMINAGMLSSIKQIRGFMQLDLQHALVTYTSQAMSMIWSITCRAFLLRHMIEPFIIHGFMPCHAISQS